MAHWTEIARQSHTAAFTGLVNSMPSISVPVADSSWTAPGWLFDGILFSTVPDVQYPWDPAVLKFIREFDPEAIPIQIRYAYRWCNYHELGRIELPVVIMRHGIARYVRDPKFPVWDFPCEMTSVGKSFHQPNQVRDIWQDNQIRPNGPDLPGAYMPFDFPYAYALLDADRRAMEFVSKSIATTDAQGIPIAKGAGRLHVDAAWYGKVEKAEKNKSEAAYAMKQVTDYYREEPTESEWKNATFADAASGKRSSVLVPDAPQPSEGTSGANQGADA